MKNISARMAFVIQDLFRLGAQYSTSLVAEGLSQRGYQIDIILSGVHRKISQERPDLLPFPIPKQARVVNLPSVRASRNIMALAKYFRQEQPAIILPQSEHYTQAAILASLMVRKKQCIMPVVHSGGIVAKANKRNIFKFDNTITEMYNRLLNTWCYSRVEKILTVSRGTAAEVTEVHRVNPRKMEVVYNPVINGIFEEKVKCAPEHPWLNCQDIPVIVAAGAHDRIKGFDVLIRAFGEVLHQRSCRLIIFGEGREHDNLINLAHTLGLDDYITFPGYTNNLPANIVRASVFVVASHFESFSIVLVEALACGTPVVATNCQSGPPEILAGGKYGILVEPNNPHAMAEGIIQVLDGKGIVPPAESWMPYCLDAVIDKYESIFNNYI